MHSPCWRKKFQGSSSQLEAVKQISFHCWAAPQLLKREEFADRLNLWRDKGCSETNTHTHRVSWAQAVWKLLIHAPQAKREEASRKWQLPVEDGLIFQLWHCPIKFSSLIIEASIQSNWGMAWFLTLVPSLRKEEDVSGLAVGWLVRSACWWGPYQATWACLVLTNVGQCLCDPSLWALEASGGLFTFYIRGWCPTGIIIGSGSGPRPNCPPNGRTRLIGLECHYRIACDVGYLLQINPSNTALLSSLRPSTLPHQSGLDATSGSLSPLLIITLCSLCLFTFLSHPVDSEILGSPLQDMLNWVSLCLRLQIAQEQDTPEISGASKVPTQRLLQAWVDTWEWMALENSLSCQAGITLLLTLWLRKEKINCWKPTI